MSYLETALAGTGRQNHGRVLPAQPVRSPLAALDQRLHDPDGARFLTGATPGLPGDAAGGVPEDAAPDEPTGSPQEASPDAAAGRTGPAGDRVEHPGPGRVLPMRPATEPPTAAGASARWPQGAPSHADGPDTGPGRGHAPTPDPGHDHGRPDVAAPGGGPAPSPALPDPAPGHRAASGTTVTGDEHDPAAGRAHSAPSDRPGAPVRRVVPTGPAGPGRPAVSTGPTVVVAPAVTPVVGAPADDAPGAAHPLAAALAAAERWVATGGPGDRRGPGADPARGDTPDQVPPALSIGTITVEVVPARPDRRLARAPVDRPPAPPAAPATTTSRPPFGWRQR